MILPILSTVAASSLHVLLLIADLVISDQWVGLSTDNDIELRLFLQEKFGYTEALIL